MPGPVQSVERAAAVLRLLAAGHERLGVVDVGAALGLPKGTAHGLLRTLVGVGFVEQDPRSGKYQLGQALLHLGSSALDPHVLRSRALNWADALASRSDESVRIGVLRQDRVVVVHHVFRPDDTAQELDVGTLLPAHASALGKVLLAGDPRASARVAARGLEPFTRRTVVARQALVRELVAVREGGWAAEVEETEPGRAGVAAPVRAAGGLVVGAVGLVGPVDRVCLPGGRPRTALVTLVRDAARSISEELRTA